MLKKTFGSMLIVFLIAAGWGGGRRAAAQEPPANLLANGSLEGPYYAEGGATRTVPHDWKLWVGLGAPESVPNSDQPQVLDEAISWKLKQNSVAFAAAGYQQVSGQQVGDTVRAAAYGWVFTCNDPATSCAISDPPYHRSDTAAGVSLKVGLDPTGGTNPLSASVRWSAAVAPYDQWAEISVVTAAQADTVTVFLYMIQSVGLATNEVFWDKASLSPAAGTEADGGDVPFVVPQGVRPDGSIVHVVQAGDTMWSIAYAYLDYGVTVDSIAALNGLKPNTRFLQPGQQLIILPPGSVDPVTGQPVTPGAAGVPPASPAPGTSTPEAVASPEIAASLDVPTALPTLETVPLPGANTAEPTATVEPTSEPTRSPTQTPAPTLTPVPIPSSTPEGVAAVPEDLTNTLGELCITVFLDADLNTLRGAGEALVDSATLVIVGSGGNASLDYFGANGTFCQNVQPRQYQIEVQLPAGYGPTTPDRVLVRVVAGRRADVVFGAASGYTRPAVPEVTPGAQAEGEVDPGEVAPLVHVPVAPAKTQGTSLVDRLYDNSAFIVLGVGVVVVVGSLVLIFFLRRPGV